MISFFFDATSLDILNREIAVDSVSGSDVFFFPEDASLVPSLDRCSAYGIAESFRLWLIDPARPWESDWPSPTNRASLRFSETSTGTIRFYIEFVSGHPFATYFIIPDNQFTPLVGWVDEEIDDNTFCEGTSGGGLATAYCDLFKVESWARWSVEKGVASQSAGYSTTAPSVALRRPSVSGLYSLRQMLALNEAIKTHNSPRKAFVYQSDFAVWREVVIADISYERVDPLLYDVGFKAVG